MKRIILLFSIAFFSLSTTFGQQGKPLKFGIELDGKLKKVEPNASYDSPTGAVYVGMFAELFVTNHFSGKLKAGMNNTYYHEDEYTITIKDQDPYVSPEISKVKQTLGISFEPRFYFFSTEQLRKINPYVALPVVFESAPIGKTYPFSAVRSELMIVPALGFRYDFTGNWGIEASGGLGWGRYFQKYDSLNPSLRKQEMEYSLSVGLRYTF